MYFCSTSFCNGTKRDRIDAKHRCSDSNRNVVCSRVVYDGGLAGNYVNVSSSLKFDISGREFIIQDILDQIVPGILPLAVVMGVYWFYTKKGLKVTQALLWLTLILIILAGVGIL